jgi:serine/threonine protein kinase
MPFVEGESLRDRLNREKQLPVEDALRIATDAARALQYAHQHGISATLPGVPDAIPDPSTPHRRGARIAAGQCAGRAMT